MTLKTLNEIGVFGYMISKKGELLIMHAEAG